MGQKSLLSILLLDTTRGCVLTSDAALNAARAQAARVRENKEAAAMKSACKAHDRAERSERMRTARNERRVQLADIPVEQYTDPIAPLVSVDVDKRSKRMLVAILRKLCYHCPKTSRWHSFFCAALQRYYCSKLVRMHCTSGCAGKKELEFTIAIFLFNY